MYVCIYSEMCFWMHFVLEVKFFFYLNWDNQNWYWVLHTKLLRYIPSCFGFVFHFSLIWCAWLKIFTESLQTKYIFDNRHEHCFTFLSHHHNLFDLYISGKHMYIISSILLICNRNRNKLYGIHKEITCMIHSYSCLSIGYDTCTGCFKI